MIGQDETHATKAAGKPAPCFAVVGHPNKGKSSIVATLAADDRVVVSATPGTTTAARLFPMTVDGRTLYTLVDTPGFQRARGVLSWLKQHAPTADARPAAVAAFVAEPKHAKQFPDEVALLKPLVDAEHPAGILYVVDGSVPYGPEYEAEMEVLRWTGRPSLALINPIGQADHTEAWQAALGQYFRVVRVFNAVTAEFSKRLELLRAFGQMDDAWREPLGAAVLVLESDRRRRCDDAADAVARLIVGALTHAETKKLGPNDNPDPYKSKLLEAYKGGLRRQERSARDAVQAAYDHTTLERVDAVDLEGVEQAGDGARVEKGGADAGFGDLFSQEAWLAFGLRRRDLVLAGAGGGAAAGGAVDIAAHGTTLFLAAAIGAVVGGALGWLGADKLADVKLISRPLGGQLLKCGPTKNPNFPFVLLGRARHHHTLVAGRTHAQRGALVMDADQAGAMNPLSDTQRKALSAAFKRVAKAGDDAEALARARAAVAAAVGNVFLDEGL